MRNYMLTIYEGYSGREYNISVTPDMEHMTSFPAVVGNPNYDAFLTQAELTDAEVHELTPDIWYDFPETPTA